MSAGHCDVTAHIESSGKAVAERVSNTRLMALAGAALIVVTGGVVYFGHLYQLQGGSVSGTIAPAESYQSSQIQDAKKNPSSKAFDAGLKERLK